MKRYKVKLVTKPERDIYYIGAKDAIGAIKETRKHLKEIGLDKVWKIEAVDEVLIEGKS